VSRYASRSVAPVVAAQLETGATYVLRGGLVVLVLWFGAFKFTQTEAHAIQPLIANSPLLSWLYSITDLNGASRVIGVAEIVIAGLIALRPFAPRLSALGSIAAIGMFLTTLSFLISTPGMWAHVEGFVVPSEGGAFLVKDVFLLGAAAWTAAEALRAGSRPRS
jgi:uncharacterized membrane protein YkgB